MKPSKIFKELIVWQKAHQFVLAVYRYTAKFPKEETYGLTSQFRRAAVSIAANIAEGYARKTKADKLRLLNIAQASLSESKYYGLLSNDLGYGENDDLEPMADEIGRLLTGYSRSIENPRTDS